MTEFKSNRLPVNAPTEKVYNFLSDFTNFKYLMPPQVKNWEATPDTCSFSVEGLAELNMRMSSKTPEQNVHIISDGKNPVEYTLDIFFYPNDMNASEVELLFNARLNPFMKMMAARPLQNFVDILATKIQEHFA